MALSSSQLRKGTVYKDGGRTFVVLNYEHIKRGRQPAVYKVKIKDIETGSITDRSYKDADRFEEADIVKRSAQFLYRDDSNLFFMFTDTFEQFSLPVSDYDWEKNFLVEGLKVITMALEENIISIELPKTVSLKVTESDPAVAGNTATGATKKATVETGFELDVPLFVGSGDSLEINTDRGEYVSRSK